VFYFSPGDQDYPVYHQKEIGKVLANGVVWAKPVVRTEPIDATFHPDGWIEKN
jgi:trehalose utilization protein